METPFFPFFRPRFAACGSRSSPPTRPPTLLRVERLFGALIPSGLLSAAEEGPNSRARVFSLRRTFWGFLYQVLPPRCACREVVRQIQALVGLEGAAGSVQEGTSAYCQARRRLPLDRLEQIRRATAAQAEALLDSATRTWNGLGPKVIDGTTLSLPDTAQNQKAYPQSRSQKPGCGFPLLKWVGVFSLGSGALLDYAKGNQHEHELSLLHRLLDQFRPGDLALADRGFSSFTLMALLLLQGAKSLFRLHQRRRPDLRQGKPLGRHDRLIRWSKPKDRPPYLPQALWKRVPQTLEVRVLRFTVRATGFRTRRLTLVTTLVDPVAYPAEELAALYFRRWRIELWFRDLKTTLGMESLRCKSPELVHKELEMGLIAYNLIRVLMAEAHRQHPGCGSRLSFKGSVDAARQYSLVLAQARSRKKQQQLVDDLLRIIATDQVPDRPGRREPRALKRRHKNYPLLNCPRHRYREIPHRTRHRKNRGLI